MYYLTLVSLLSIFLSLRLMPLMPGILITDFLIDCKTVVNVYRGSELKRLSLCFLVPGYSKEQHPPEPTLGELSASNITTTSVRLSWTVPSGNFASFSLHYRDAEGKPQSLPLNGTSREVVVSNLVPSRKFKFNLYGISGQKRFGPISTEAVTGQRHKISWED